MTWVPKKGAVTMVEAEPQPNRWRLLLSCGHTMWRYVKRKPKVGREYICGRCSHYTVTPRIRIRVRF